MIRKQLQALRDAMATHKIDAYLIPTDDFHGSEYVGAHFACRKYVSGFTGSAGTLLVFPSWAGLWTDGRYFLQAEAQLEDSGIHLMKTGQPGVPTLEQFLYQSLRPEQVLGYDGRCVNARKGKWYHTAMKRLGASVNDRLDLVEEIWPDRPPLSAKPAWLLADKYAGETRASKLDRVREAMVSQKADCFLLTSLEDIGWLLNLRGGDVCSNPVVLSYLALTKDTCLLFANPSALSREILDALEADGVFLRPYDAFYSYANHISEENRVLLDGRRVNSRVITSIHSKVAILDRPNPTEAMKAIKNATEIANEKTAHLRDGIALTKFMHWLKTKAVQEGATELSAADYLESLRREQPEYLQPSFAPILAYGPHSAVIHYSATEETNVPLRAEGFLLADTGGHYLTGTTDCTRTYAMGPVTAEQKARYTAVLRGNLALADTVFRDGCTGTNLDYAARKPLWDMGLDFNHGTGHGVGYLLSVHEGPQNISRRSTSGRDAALRPGMITSDEPGVYFDGAYGIRLENLLLCVEKQKTDFGRFLGFETLTLTPFDLDAVDSSLLSCRERTLLNAYHARVREALSPYLTEGEQDWLSLAARPVE